MGIVQKFPTGEIISPEPTPVQRALNYVSAGNGEHIDEETGAIEYTQEFEIIYSLLEFISGLFPTGLKDL